MITLSKNEQYSSFILPDLLKMKRFEKIAITQLQKIMNKCEHGQKITTFCASDCCVWKQAAGCDICMKKYHNHMGPTIFLTEDEIVALVKKYTMDSNIKPKCRLLQEAIYSYFNLIKNQITSSIDTVCKNIINQIGYPYLYSNNTLSTYKRLKNKEYKKLIQKQFKNLFQLSQKINQKDLTKEQSKIYIQQMKNTEQLLNGLEDIVKRYESIIKNSYSVFTHDTSYISKINDILKTLNSESVRKASRAKDLKERESIKPQMTTSWVKEKDDKLKSPPELKRALTEQQPSTVNRTFSRPPMINVVSPTVLRPNYSRDVSIDRNIVRQPRFANPAVLKTQVPKQIDPKIFEIKPIATQKIQTTKQQANVKQLQINQRKKILIDMMKQKQESLKRSSQIQKKEENKAKTQVEKPSFFKRQLSERSAYDKSQTSQSEKYQEFDMNLKDESEQNSNNQFEITDGSTKNQERDAGNHHAFTQLPLIENDSKKSSQIQEVKEKVYMIPRTKQLELINSNYDEISSPIFKNFNKSTIYNKPKHKQSKQTQQQKADQKQQQLVKKRAISLSKNSQVLQLKQNQQKSVALLLKALALNAQQAIKYLLSALNQSENNLSAAEYLTYLYLQQDRPHDCLHLCNKMLEKLMNSNQPEDLAFIINNNKAAALNILGRYSQSIVVLEKCLRNREKDYFYKNLGDAYFSISIYEKAIYNYQKCLKINDCYDEAQYNLAVCLYIQENYFNAKLAIKKALQMQPQNDNYLQLLQNIETRITHC